VEKSIESEAQPTKRLGRGKSCTISSPSYRPFVEQENTRKVARRRTFMGNESVAMRISTEIQEKGGLEKVEDGGEDEKEQLGGVRGVEDKPDENDLNMLFESPSGGFRGSRLQRSDEPVLGSMQDFFLQPRVLGDALRYL
jgi:hypothetical protein